MPLTKKTLRNFYLEKNTPTVGTFPERCFNAYQESRGLSLLWDRTGRRISFLNPETNEIVKFQCDFLHPVDSSYDLDYEVDGEKFHSSPIQLGNDRWRDRVLNANGIRVIRIPAAVCVPKFWYHLDETIPKAQASKEGTVRIPG